MLPLVLMKRYGDWCPKLHAYGDFACGIKRLQRPARCVSVATKRAVAIFRLQNNYENKREKSIPSLRIQQYNKNI